MTPNGPWRRPTIDERTLVSHFKQLGLNIRTVLPGHGPAATQGDVERYWRLITEVKPATAFTLANSPAP